MGPGLYRLEDTPVFANRGDDPIHAGDVLELEPQPDGSYMLTRVAERSPMRHFMWVVPRSFVESPHYRAYAADVESVGGAWEVAFGGVVWVHLPPDSTFDAAGELTRRVALAKPAAE